ncbi:MAG: serine hydrolase domain-containing protein [Actinomycetales bacterium]
MIGSDPGRPPFPVTLENWQTPEQVGWTFTHMDEIFPTAPIHRGVLAPSLPRVEYQPDDLPVSCYDASVHTVAEVMSYTHTDGWMVLRDDPVTGPQVLLERYGQTMGPATRHLLMSVSKSIVGVVVGALAGQGMIDPTAPLTRYIPELTGCGYDGATVRHLLDMRSGIRFSEDYLDSTAEVRLLEQAFGWAPRTSPDVPTNLRAFLQSLRRDREHGGVFEYRSCESDVLGWVIEAVTGARFAEVASNLVWSRIGAEFDANIGVDSQGSGMFDGGISATLGDLARFGLMILRDGTSVTGEQVVPDWWIAESVHPDHDSVAAFAASPGDNRMPGGFYRNQFWIPDAARPVLLCLGIHGQMVYVNRHARVVAVKLSSWPTPQDAWKLFSTLAAFDAVSSQLASG